MDHNIADASAYNGSFPWAYTEEWSGIPCLVGDYQGLAGSDGLVEALLPPGLNLEDKLWSSWAAAELAEKN